MAEIEIVIKIPEEEYRWIKESDNSIFADIAEKECILYAIKNGTTLPKGHGRLGDLDKIANEVNALKDNWNRYGNEYESGRYKSYDYALDVIEDATTIIEADTESEDKE